MKKRIMAAAVAALLLAMPAWAQNSPLTLGGKATPGDLPKIQNNREVTSAGGILGDANGKGVNPFTVNDRGDKGICFRNGAVSSAHTALCFGHDKDGNAIISFDSLGGAGLKQWLCQVNGVTTPCGIVGGGANPGGAIGDIQTNYGSGILAGTTPGSGIMQFLRDPAGHVLPNWLAQIAGNSILANPTSTNRSPVALAIPDCPDVGGKHLNYTDSTLICGGSGGGGTGSGTQLTWGDGTLITWGDGTPITGL